MRSRLAACGNPVTAARSRRAGALAAILLSAAALVVGCGGGDEPAARTSTDVATSGATSPTATGAERTAMTFSAAPDQPLVPGRYETTGFAVPFSITLDDGWSAGGGELPDIVDVFRQDSDSAALAFFAGVRVLDPEDGTTALDPPADPGAFLHDHPRLEAGPTREIELAGRPATAFEFSVASPLTTPRCPGPCVPIAALSDGQEYGLLEGERGRVVVLETGDVPLVIVSSAPAEEAEAHLARTDGLMRSLRLPSA